MSKLDPCPAASNISMVSIVTPRMTVHGFDSNRNYWKIVGKKRAGSAHVFFFKYIRKGKENKTYFHKHFLGQTEDVKGIFFGCAEFYWFTNNVGTFKYFL